MTALAAASSPVPGAAGRGDITAVRLAGWRPPRPGWTPLLMLAVAGLLEILGQIVAAPLLTWVAAGFVGAVLAAGFSTPGLRGLELAWSCPARMQAGMPSTVTVTLTGGRRTRTVPVVVTLFHPALPVQSVAVRPGSRDEPGSGRAVLLARPAQRGVWGEVGEIEVEVTSPLGGWRRRRRVPLGRPLVVHPGPAPPFPLVDYAEGAGRPGAPRPRSGPDGGDDVMAMREWHAGDPTARIHWRASARHDRLIVVERERWVRGRLVVVTGPPHRGAVWESAVAQAAATCLAALRAGVRVELCLAGGRVVARGPAAMLDIFAGLELQAPAPGTELGNLGPEGGMILWIAESAPPPDLHHRVGRGRFWMLDVVRAVAAGEPLGSAA
jgi:uncharacterized protein (DUF58 family)